MLKNKKIKIEDYFLFTKNNNRAYIDIIKPVVYSNSAVFNSFDYSNQFKNIDELSLKINANLVFDSFLIILIEELRTYCKLNSIKLVIVSENDNFDAYWEFISKKTPSKLKKEKTNSIIDFFEGIGKSSRFVIKDLAKFIEFIGEIFIKIITISKHFKEIRWLELPSYLIKVGINSLPICLLIVFLIGIIIGYVGALQLSRFGVPSFLAPLVGIAITRELSPLMVGIIIAGRTGSSFTAEIGTMKVSEEIDALKAFGFDRHYLLVFPRLFATIISMPLIVSICNIIGIIGGFIAGNIELNISFNEFQMQLLDSTLSYIDILSGIIKSSIFGGIIGIVGCYKGFQVSGGAESVGKYTTSSVVTSIFLIVLVDAVFAFIM
jgi:phospholipid/cholesterol/gamma-HCH transport system permease protein